MFCLVVKYLANENGEDSNEQDIESADYTSQNTNNANLLELSSLRGTIQNEMNKEILEKMLQNADIKNNAAFDFNHQNDINNDVDHEN